VKVLSNPSVTLSRKQRTHALERLADGCTTQDLEAVVDPGLRGEALREAWSIYLAALHRLERFDKCDLDWQDVIPELRCMDPDTVVADHLRDEVADALSTLLDGR
jgi:hypothetical protein